MSVTFLSHIYNDCGGNIVLDASASTKLYAPSFSISSAGIEKVTLDIDVVPGGRLIPAFWCKKCGETVNLDNIGEHLSAACQICGRRHPVKLIYVHNYIPSICNKCLEGIITYCKDGEVGDPRIRDYVETYSLTKSIKVVPLEQVLKSPIIL